MHIVEIHRFGEGLSAPMAQMRTWLDHRQIQPVYFEFALLPNRDVRFRLHFREAEEAAAFAGAFLAETTSDQEQRNLAA